MPSNVTCILIISPFWSIAWICFWTTLLTKQKHIFPPIGFQVVGFQYWEEHIFSKIPDKNHKTHGVWPRSAQTPLNLSSISSTFRTIRIAQRAAFFPWDRYGSVTWVWIPCGNQTWQWEISYFLGVFHLIVLRNILRSTIIQPFRLYICRGLGLGATLTQARALK